MVNKISLKCPECNYEDADVLYIVEITGTKKVRYRCLASGKKHQFEKSLTEDIQYQEFFDSKVYKK